MSLSAQQALDLLADSVATTTGLVGGIADDRWKAPSPCPDMDVLELVEHLVGGLTQFAQVGSGVPIENAAFECSFAPADARSEYALAGDRMISTWSGHGVATRSYPMPWGETEGIRLLEFMLIEQVTHGWDIARATGQDPGYDAGLVRTTLELCAEFDDDTIRGPGMFGPIVSITDDAAPIDRLAAFLGRHPDQWPGPRST